MVAFAQDLKEGGIKSDMEPKRECFLEEWNCVSKRREGKNKANPSPRFK